jgi:erythromycin esterase
LELKGRLETPDGRAASGARVALARGTDVIGDVGVASDGSFTLNVQAGELYVLAATHPEFGAARVAIVPNGATSPLRLSLGKTCPVVHGTLHDEFGQPFVAARVIFWSGAPDPDTPYTVHTDRSGQFAVALSPGSYVISAGDGMKAIAFEHPSHAELELRAFRRPPSVLPASPEELAFVRAHAHPVGQGAAWPEHWLDGALVVGLGQQTHGARQGYELMYRLARELIEQHGFSVIALEAGHAETLALDAWAAPAAPGATNASDDGARQRLDQLASWLWQNTETLDFVRWVRALNGRRPAARRVRFVGLDVQRLAPIASQLELRVRAHSRAELGADPAQLQAELAGAGSCRELPPALGEGAAWARLARGDASAAKLLRDLEQCRAAAASDAARDRALADNAEEATASGRAKVVVLAHNVHVARERLGRAQSAPMGQWLAAALGERYRAVGFLVGRGSFWGEHLALGRGPAAQRGPLELDPVAAGSLEAVLADQDGSYLLPLRESGARWPGPVRKMRDIGAGYAPEYAEYFWSPLVVERSFDALAVVPHTDAIHERPW